MGSLWNAPAKAYSNGIQVLALLTLSFCGLLPAQTPAPLKVYVFSTGDSVSDTALIQALKDRGYLADLVILSSAFNGTNVPLTNYHTVLLAGSGTRMQAAGIA